jgi:DNA-binding PadR family transcriptional regulator
MGHFLGTTEHMVLLAIIRRGGKAHGAAILETLESAAGRAPSSGALSTTLDRLEENGLIQSSYQTGGSRRGGRPKRIATVTAAGRARLAATRAAFRKLQDRPQVEGA